MNILHICSISNNKTSGVSNVVPEHLKHQKKYINVALLNCNKERNELLKEEDNVYYLDEVKSINNLPKPFNNPDLVIFHSYYIIEFKKIYKYLIKNKIPYVIIPHGAFDYRAQNQKKLKKVLGNILLFDKFYKNAIAIQYLSIDEQKNSKRFKKKSFVIGNGVNIPKKTKTKFSKNGLKLLYIGRYSIYTKGLDIIIDFANENKEELIKNNIIIDFYGTGADGIEKVKELVKYKNVSNIINVNGPIFGEEKEKVILDHDMFIQLSRHEGQPLGIMEAMSYGLPVIVSEGTTFGDIVKDNKCGIKYYNNEDLLTKLKKIINNVDSVNSLSTNSYYYVKKKLAWSIVSKVAINNYKSVGDIK